VVGGQLDRTADESHRQVRGIGAYHNRCPMAAGEGIAERVGYPVSQHCARLHGQVGRAGGIPECGRDRLQFIWLGRRNDDVNRQLAERFQGVE
jgi:hypothetical protein